MANAYVWSLPTIAENDATACSVSMELNSQDSGVCIFFFKEMDKRSSLLNQIGKKVNEETVIEDSTTCY